MADKDKKTKKPTALKRDIQNVTRRDINRGFKSEVRTITRNFETSLKAGKAEDVTANLSKLYSLMDKGVKRGIYKKNKASRTKARLCARAAKA